MFDGWTMLWTVVGVALIVTYYLGAKKGLWR